MNRPSLIACRHCKTFQPIARPRTTPYQKAPPDPAKPFARVWKVMSVNVSPFKVPELTSSLRHRPGQRATDQGMV